jgi:hypothetical protein
MFVQNHVRDFEAVLAATEPFALVRFGDGESALVDGRSHQAASGEWRVHGAHWLRKDLLESLWRCADRFCIGLPPPCCLYEHIGLHRRARAPESQRTFATLFLHGNLGRTAELVEKFEPIIVGRTGQIPVPADGMDRGCDLDAIVAAMLDAERPMFVSAGPLANVLIDRYWLRQAPEKRQIVLDVGSSLDRFLTGTNTRYYHQGPQLSHHCSYGRVSPNPNPAPQGVTMRASTRVVVGRLGRGTSAAVGGARSRKSVQARAVGTATTRRVAAANPTTDAVAVGGGKRSRCAKCVRQVRSRH